MTQQDFFNRAAEICGQRLVWTRWSNTYQREMPSTNPRVMRAMKDGWTYNADIQFEPNVVESNIPNNPEWYYASIYQKSKDLLLILTRDTDGTYTLQENLDNGDIIYHVDRAKTLAKCLRKLADMIA